MPSMPSALRPLPNLLLAALLLGLTGCALLHPKAASLPTPAAPVAQTTAAPAEAQGNAIDTAVNRSAEDIATVLPEVRSAAAGAIATIPYEAIASFLSKPLLISPTELRSAARISLLRDDHVAVGAPHVVHIKGLAQAGAGRYAVVRAGEPLRDPQSRKLLGYLGIPIGTVQVEQTAALSEGRLVESRREAQADDLVFPDEGNIRQDFTPAPAPAGVAGEIIAVIDGVSMIGQYQVVAVNRGSEHGLLPGHLLQIRSPEAAVGTLMVFRIYPKLSYALTLRLLAPVRIAYPVVSP
ncbi:MAG: hypothetical protein NT064_01455 [Proteobacteria bacterium]|nr:hypothetical protein [Pseudomonadota bacterium]